MLFDQAYLFVESIVPSVANTKKTGANKPKKIIKDKVSLFIKLIYDFQFI
jgi:hypothetical protein